MEAHFYGQLGERIGRTIAIDPGAAATVGELRRLLAERFPAAASTRVV